MWGLKMNKMRNVNIFIFLFAILFLANTVYAVDYSIIDLGTLGGNNYSKAYGINNSGQIVGYSTNTSSGYSRAFLYQNGTMTDLNSLLPTGSGWVLTEAIDINNNGQIVGQGYIGGTYHAFLLTPTVVPEPISPILFITGGAVLAGRRYLRRKRENI